LEIEKNQKIKESNEKVNKNDNKEIVHAFDNYIIINKKKERERFNEEINISINEIIQKRKELKNNEVMLENGKICQCKEVQMLTIDFNYDEELKNSLENMMLEEKNQNRRSLIQKEKIINIKRNNKILENFTKEVKNIERSRQFNEILLREKNAEQVKMENLNLQEFHNNLKIDEIFNKMIKKNKYISEDYINNFFALICVESYQRSRENIYNAFIIEAEKYEYISLENIKFSKKITKVELSLKEKIMFEEMKEKRRIGKCGENSREVMEINVILQNLIRDEKIKEKDEKGETEKQLRLESILKRNEFIKDVEYFEKYNMDRINDEDEKKSGSRNWIIIEEKNVLTKLEIQKNEDNRNLFDRDLNRMKLSFNYKEIIKKKLNERRKERKNNEETKISEKLKKSNINDEIENHIELERMNISSTEVIFDNKMNEE
jgi:hypothetical protein